MENSLMQILSPLHPKLVHFPIALIITALGLQAFGCVVRRDFLRHAAWLIFNLGVLIMPLVVWSGLAEADLLRLNHPILTEHKKFAFVAMWVSLGALPLLWVLWFKHVKFFQMAFLAVLIIVSVLLGLAAHEGGKMVYEYGVGVSQ